MCRLDISEVFSLLKPVAGGRKTMCTLCECCGCFDTYPGLCVKLASETKHRTQRETDPRTFTKLQQKLHS